MRIAIAAAVLFTTGAARLSATEPAAPPINSPRLAALQKAIRANESGALDAFWKEVSGKTPVVEAIPDTDSEVWATYLWRGDKTTERVDLIGGVPIGVAKDMTRLPGTDLWYWTERTPRVARFSYRFLVNRRLPAFGPGTAPTRNDPLAARTYAGRSIAEMPGAPAQPWSDAKEGVPAGKRQAASVPSAKLKADRKVTIYTPAGYDAKAGEHDLLIVFDGEDSGGDMSGFNVIPGHVILDNLIAAKKIPPTVAVFVESGETRDRDLGCHPAFATFVADELVPWVREKYRVSKDPKRVTASGFSRGGLGAAYCAFRHPDVIGNVIALSGAFGWSPEPDEDARKKPPVRELDREPGWLTREVVKAKPVSVRFYLEAGRFDVFIGGGILAETRRLRDVLEAKGYSVMYREPVGGHDSAVWRGSFADALLALSGK